MRILTAGQLDGYQRRKDRTVSLRFITQEKTSGEVMEIDQLLDTYGILYFRGEEQLNQGEIEELDQVELDLYDQPKSQSQRGNDVSRRPRHCPPPGFQYNRELADWEIGGLGWWIGRLVHRCPIHQFPSLPIDHHLTLTHIWLQYLCHS